MAIGKLQWQEHNHMASKDKPIMAGYKQGQPVYVCDAHFQQGIHPGYAQSGHCVITYAGHVVKLKQYKLLVGNPANAFWKDSNYSNYYPRGQHAMNGVFMPGLALPSQALNAPVISGYEHSPLSGNFHLLYTCRAFYGNDMHVGKVVSNRCNVAVDHAEISVPIYQTLFYSTRALKPNALHDGAWRIHPDSGSAALSDIGKQLLQPLISKQTSPSTLVK